MMPSHRLNRSKIDFTENSYNRKEFHMILSQRLGECAIIKISPIKDVQKIVVPFWKKMLLNKFG